MIVVTGATGNIGKALVEQLTSTGAKVRVVARDPAKASKSGGEVVKGDLSDPKSLEAAFKGADELFLLAAAGPDMAKQEKNAIEAAKKAGVKHVVLLSTAGADASSPVKLAQWHAASEQALKDSGLKWTILQPNYFIQNFFMQAGTIKGDGAFYAPLKQGKVAMVDVRDIAAVAAKALTSGGHEGKTYYLSGPAALGFDEVAAIFGKRLGKTVKYVDVPPADFKKSLVGAGVPEWFATDFVALYDAFSKGYGSAVSTSVKDVTGKPARDFDSFVAESAGAFK
jgi:uncharacterized protein YbjT (DUF2867 family)